MLLTACVSPASHPRLIRTTPADRLRDYHEALAACITLDDPLLDGLLVLENSGYDPNLLAEGVLSQAEVLGRRRHSLEIVSYVAPPRPMGIHYGYSEFQMIDHLLDRSWLSSERRGFVKMTGRYRYPDLPRLLRRLPSHTRFACDSKDYPGLFGRPPAKSAIASLFIADRDFYDRHVRRLYTKMGQEPRHTHIEDLIFDHLIELHGQGGVWLRFPVNCEPNGTGGDGENLRSVKRILKSSVRAVCRAVIPGLWL